MNRMDKNAMVEHLTLPDGKPFDMCIEKIGEPYESTRNAITAGCWHGSKEQWEIWSKFLMDTYAPGEPPGKATNDKIRAAIREAVLIPIYDLELSTVKFIPNQFKPFKPKPKQATFNLHEKRKAQAKLRNG